MCGFLQRWFLRHSSAAFSVLEYIHPVSLMLAPHWHVSTHCSLIRRPPVRRGMGCRTSTTGIVRRGCCAIHARIGHPRPMPSLPRVVRRRPRRSRASGRILLPCIHTVRKAALRCRFLVSPQWSACVVAGQSLVFSFRFLMIRTRCYLVRCCYPSVGL